MAVKAVEKKEAFCDICGRNYANNCAACNNMVCSEHSIELRIRHFDKEITRIVCPECLGIAIEDIISGNNPSAWKGEEWKDSPNIIRPLLFQPDTLEPEETRPLRKEKGVE